MFLNFLISNHSICILLAPHVLLATYIIVRLQYFPAVQTVINEFPTDRSVGDTRSLKFEKKKTLKKMKKQGINQSEAFF